MYSRCIILIVLLVFFLSYSNLENIAIRNKIKFPYGGPFMGLFLAIAMPLEIPEPEVFLSYNFEANYFLPENESTFEYPPIVSRAMTIARKEIYNLIQLKIKSHGFKGKSCLLRAICEATEYTFQHTGVLADILHVILTPSTSRSENLTQYEDAENYGKIYKHCKKYIKFCPVSILNFISSVDKKFHL